MRTHVLLLTLIVTVILAGCQSDRRMASKDPAQRQTISTVSSISETDVEQMFRRHYDSHYATTGYSYAQYRPAYRYGFDLASDPRNQSLEWTTIERLAIRGWDSSKMGEWEQYKDAVRYGWEVQRTK